MAGRKSINIYIPKYFMAVRNCINILVLDGGYRYVSINLRISAKCVTARNSNARINTSS